MAKIKGLRATEPYVAGSQPSGEHIIKLNTNENAYGPSPKVADAFSHFDTHRLRKYSTLNQEALRVALAKQHGLDPSQIIIGNGSDDILSMAFLAFFNSGQPVLFPDLTYGFYKVWADLYHIPFIEVPLNQAFEIDVEDYMRDCGGIVLANPNAPTGIYKSLDDLEKLIKAHPDVVVIVDEAYINFGGKTALPLLKKYDNLFITRTFSKDASLAGLRVGYGIGNPNLMAVINAVKNAINPYNVDLIAEELAVAAVESWDYYEGTCQKIMATRHWFSEALSQLGFTVLESQTNFVLAECPNHEAPALFDYLQAHQIHVRYFPKVKRLQNHLRISIGNQAEMGQVIVVIKAFQEAS